MRICLLLLLCIGSVSLCLAQDRGARVGIRVRECGAHAGGCRWVKPGTVVLGFTAAHEGLGSTHARAVRRAGRLEVALIPGTYAVRAYPPGLVVRPGRIEVGAGRTSLVVTAYQALSEQAPGFGGGETSSPCRVTGCNGELCAAEDTQSSCEWSPAYSCLSRRHCISVAGGGCQWRDLPSITRCMERQLR